MSETKSVLSGIVHFNLFDDIAFYIDAIIIGLAIIFAILVICIVIKKFLCDKKINSKTFSIYNEIMYYKKNRDSDKLSFAIMDYLGFRVLEEEIKFILAT